MAADALKKKIADVLKSGYFKDSTDFVDVSDGDDDDIHVVVVSRKFDGKRTSQKRDLIWSELTQHLRPDEWAKVSLSIGKSPEEIKAGI
jgi:acid stress-induced BolA-like protein IbaG/YrbA